MGYWRIGYCLLQLASMVTGLLVTVYWLLVNSYWLLGIGLLAIGYGLPTFGYWLLLVTVHYNTVYVHPGYRLERNDKITYVIVTFIGLPTADPYF